MFRLLVTGSRKWDDWDTARAALAVFHDEHGEHVTLVHGGAKGADRICAAIAQEFGWTVEEHPADWNTYGRAAGPIRNTAMVKMGADHCVAFVKLASKGTRHCLAAARQSGIPVTVYRESSDTEAALF